MDELLNYIIKFNEILQKQIESFLEFIPILDQEELAIANYDLALLEKIIVVKDQHSRIAQSLEDRRIYFLKKICYLIAFDSRGQNLSLNLFKVTFSTYLKNIKSLVNQIIFEKLSVQEENFNKIACDFEKTFELVYPRIYRNEVILKKLAKHISLSLSLFQTDAEVGMNYDSLGKSHSFVNRNSGISSMRIKA